MGDSGILVALAIWLGLALGCGSGSPLRQGGHAGAAAPSTDAVVSPSTDAGGAGAAGTTTDGSAAGAAGTTTDGSAAGIAGASTDGSAAGAAGTTTDGAALSPVLVSIVVTPAVPTIARGSTQQFVATGTFDDATTKDLSATVTWTSSTPTVATISGAGLAGGVAAGISVISATNGPLSGSATLTVTETKPKLLSIVVTPSAPTIPHLSTQRFVATGTFDDATTQDLSATVLWSSSTPATATISNVAPSKGEATGVGFGTTVITATLGAVSGSTTLTVSTAHVVSIVVTPTLPSIPTGTTQQFVATGIHTDGTVQDVSTLVTWTSARPATATISSSGLATAASPGTTVITATFGPISGDTTLTVFTAEHF